MEFNSDLRRTFIESFVTIRTENKAWFHLTYRQQQREKQMKLQQCKMKITAGFGVHHRSSISSKCGSLFLFHKFQGTLGAS
jgi:hypothetical protein